MEPAFPGRAVVSGEIEHIISMPWCVNILYAERLVIVFHVGRLFDYGRLHAGLSSCALKRSNAEQETTAQHAVAERCPRPDSRTDAIIPRRRTSCTDAGLSLSPGTLVRPSSPTSVALSVAPSCAPVHCNSSSPTMYVHTSGCAP